MKVATFNANSIRARLDPLLAWLDRNQPDVLCVQETKVEDALFPALPFNEHGYHAVFRGQKSYNGVALFSRLKPRDMRFGLDDGGPADETRLLYAKVGPLHVVNTYVPQGRELDHEMYRYKLEWFARLRAYFERHFTTRMKVVWVGDMNVACEAIDVHNPEAQSRHVCFHEDVRKAFAATANWGFVDVFRLHQPGPGLYSFFDYRTPNAAKRKMGWRIDLIMATPCLARRSSDACIDLEPRLQEKPSDHTFVVADFEIAL